MNCVNQRKPNLVLGFLLISIFCIIQSSNLFLSYIGNSLNGLITLITFLYIVVYCLITRKTHVFLSKLSISVVLFLGVAIIYRLISKSSAAWGNYYLLGSASCCLLVMEFVCSEFPERQKKSLFNCILLSFFIDTVYNIFFFSIESHGITEDYYLKAENSTALSILTCCLVVLFIFEANKKNKIFYFVFLLLVSYLNIVILSRATNVILLFLIVFMIIYFRKNDYQSNTSGKKVRIAFLLVILTVILLCLPYVLSNIISKLSIDSRIKSRLEGLLYFLNGEDYITNNQSSFSNRVLLWQTSLKTPFASLKNFIFGIGDHRYTSGSISSAVAIGIGGHSDILDNFARYGLIGEFLFISIYVQAFKKMKSMFSQCPYRTDLLLIFVFYTFRSIFGVCYLPTINVANFILVPLVPFALNLKSKRGGQTL